MMQTCSRMCGGMTKNGGCCKSTYLNPFTNKCKWHSHEQENTTEKAKTNTNECSICLDTINDKDLYQTSCNHTFHRSCIQKWVQKHLSCPLCRTDIIDHECNDHIPDDKPDGFNVLLLLILELDNNVEHATVYVDNELFRISEKERRDELFTVIEDVAPQLDIDCYHPEFKWRYSIS